MKLLRNEKGQGMTEYIIIVALVAIAAIAAFTYFGKTVRTQADVMTQELAGKDGSATQGKLDDAATKAAGDAEKSKSLKNYADGAKAGE